MDRNMKGTHFHKKVDVDSKILLEEKSYVSTC